MEESVKKERQNVVEITETYEHLKKKAGEQEKEIHLLEDASRRNVEMEHSLQDIAQLVEDEVDEVDLAIETNHSPALVKFSSFEWVNIFFHIAIFTNLTFAKGQLISKQNCRAITSSKKQTLDFYF